MVFIDKNDPVYSKLGNRLVSRFITSCWQENPGSYINLTYNEFRRGGGMYKLLSRQQENRCCYCMRMIEGANGNLEHIVPQSVDDVNELLEYQRKGLVSTDIFILNNRNVPMQLPPYPHFIAYQNLALSCYGEFVTKDKKKCCNSERKNRYIIPIFLDSNVSTRLIYEKDGSLVYVDDLSDTINNLGLEHETLVKIRRIWFFLSDQLSIAEFEQARINHSYFSDLLEQNGHIPIDEKLTYNNPTYWKLLFEYSWFFGYFQNRG